MDKHDIEGARAVVLYLCRNGLRWYRKQEMPRAWKITYGKIRDGFSIVHAEEEVEGTLFRGKGAGGIVGGKNRKRYILLAPPASSPSVVCLLGAYWELSAKAIEMTLDLHLFGQSQLQDIPIWHRGYRLEMPHPRGIHDYPHVQPVKTTVWPKKIPIPFAEQDVPDNFPTFPFRGNKLTTLCAALAIALSSAELPNILHELRGNRMQSHVQNLLK